MDVPALSERSVQWIRTACKWQQGETLQNNCEAREQVKGTSKGLTDSGTVPKASEGTCTCTK